MYKVGDEVVLPLKIEKICNEELVGAKSEADVTYLFKIEEANKVLKPRELKSEAYIRGLKDAWELAKKIVMGVEDGGFDSQEVIDVFGKNRYYSFKDLTAEEALAKIEAHENKINVNDIVKVKDENGLGIVTAVCPTGIVYVLWDDGGCGDYEPCELEKTGRTAEGLDFLLRQIKE